MSGNTIIYIITIFTVIAAIDRALGNKWGPGRELESAFNTMGGLALGMAGTMVAADIIGRILSPTLGRLFQFFGADEAMAVSFFLSIDTGGYFLAHNLAGSPDIANLSGVILGSMMAPTLVFNTPLTLKAIKKEDRKYLAVGTLCGIIAIPFACIAGGFLAGFDMAMVLKNIFPVFIISALIAAGLYIVPGLMIKAFGVLSDAIIFFLTLFLALAIVQELTPVHLIELLPLSDVWQVVGGIVIVLAGAYPLMWLFMKVMKAPLEGLGRKLHISDKAVAGMIACTINSVPMISMLKDMDDRGKVLNIAFACGVSFALGDYVGFCAGVEPQLLIPMILSKLFGGLLGLGIAALFMRIKKEAL